MKTTTKSKLTAGGKATAALGSAGRTCQMNIAVFNGVAIENGTLGVPPSGLHPWLDRLGMPDGFGADCDQLAIYTDNAAETGYDTIAELHTFGRVEVFAAKGRAGYVQMLATLLPVIDNIVRLRALAVRDWGQDDLARGKEGGGITAEHRVIATVASGQVVVPRRGNDTAEEDR